MPGKDDGKNVPTMWERIKNRASSTAGLRLEEIAKSMGVNRTTVSRRIRRETGLSYRENAAREKEAEAKSLLADRARPLKEIAFELKFNTLSTFSRFFHRRTGLRPTAWRLKMSNKKE